ncbi:hypothetical protein BGX26_000591 [Mortierella sp. AD094]|nr:hypothetical protein BGX26_000591 [Mortierella sp. AD094]
MSAPESQDRVITRSRSRMATPLPGSASTPAPTPATAPTCVPAPKPASKPVPVRKPAGKLNPVPKATEPPASKETKTTSSPSTRIRPYFQQVSKSSARFVYYNTTLQQKLERLYKIEYSSKKVRHLETGLWKGDYFHCTGHCSCLEGRVEKDESDDENIKPQSHQWCRERNCPIRGILRHGFLMKFSLHDGHYFSTKVDVARKFGAAKCGYRSLYAIFICKARAKLVKDESIFFVNSDHDIYPFYLAIVRA